MSTHAALLTRLSIQPLNPGACTGPDGWIAEPDGHKLTSFNPTTGEPIATVMLASPAAYDRVADAAATAFRTWREVPAPKRGEVVRDLGNALRALKEPLGDLVALEMGKIRAEGHGEVQEMIDICDFATGLSRQLYGLTIASERPGHRMMEQWHPLGAIGVITAFNFPVAVWSWNAAIAAACGDIGHLEARRADAPDGNRRPAHRQPGHGRPRLTGTSRWPWGQVGPSARRCCRITGCRSSRSRDRRPSAATSPRPWPGASAGRSWKLGGNNAIVVAADAILDMATRAILFGAVGTAGQRCIDPPHHRARQRRRRPRRAPGQGLPGRCASAIHSPRAR